TLRDRVSFLDGAHERLEQALSSTNKELRTVTGERKNLMVTVQELYDQLSNFREINKSLKDSCQKQVDEYAGMMSHMQDDKLQMALQMNRMSEELKKYKQIVADSDIGKAPHESQPSPATSLAESTWIARSLQSIIAEVKCQGTTLLHQKESADLEALKTALSTSESENRELSDLIHRQQDTIHAHEEERQALLSKLSEHERSSFLGGELSGSSAGERMSLVSVRSLRTSIAQVSGGVKKQVVDKVLIPQTMGGLEKEEGAVLAFIQEGIVPGLANTIQELEESNRLLEEQIRELALMESLEVLPLPERIIQSPFRSNTENTTVSSERAGLRSGPSSNVDTSTVPSPDQEETISHLTREIETLRQQKLDVSAELSIQTSGVADLHWKIRDLEEERNLLREQTSELKKELEEVRSAAESGNPLPTSSQVLELQEEIEEHTKSLKEFETKLTSARSRTAQIEKENHQLRRSLHLTETQASKLRTEIESLNLDKIECDRNVESAPNSQQPTTPAEYLAALSTAQKEIHRLTADLSASEQERVKMRESITQLGAQLAKQASLLGEIEWRLKDADQHHASATAKMVTAEEAKEALEVELREAKEKLRTLTLAARGSMIPVPSSSSGAALESLAESQKAFDESLAAEAKVREESIRVLKAQYQTSKNDLLASKSEVDRLSYEIVTLRNLVAQQKSNVGKAADKIMDAAADLQPESDDLRVKDLESQVERLKIEKRVLNDSLTTLGAQLALLSTKKGEDDWHLKELLTSKIQLAKANEDLKQELSGLDEKLRSAEEKIQRMQSRLESRGDKGDSINAGNRNLLDQAEEAKKREQEFEKQLQTLEKQLTADKKENEVLKSKLNETVIEKSRLTKQLEEATMELTKKSLADLNTTKFVSVGSDKFFSASDVHSKPDGGLDGRVSDNIQQYYETALNDLETKVQVLTLDLTKERESSSRLKSQIKLIQETLDRSKRDAHHDGKPTRSERRSVTSSDIDGDSTSRASTTVKCIQCLEWQLRIREILDKNFASTPDASYASNAAPKRPFSASHTRTPSTAVDTNESVNGERGDESIEELLEKIAEYEAQLKNERLDGKVLKGEWEAERRELEARLDEARTDAEEAKAALEAARLEITSKKRILKVLKQAADAEKAASNFKSGFEDIDTTDLGSCDFLASKLTKSAEVEQKLQSLLKDNLMLQEKRVHLETKLSETEEEM
ncbi:hypothetical protein HDU67_000579, partial [Dinochytrium kinnereticum]